ncbi:MAG: hypothetical protein ACKO66_09020 [Flavobacteriales bacterium]
MMSKDFLSQRVKSALHDFQPEVPAAVYSKMRRKLWLNGFLRWNPASLNVWYVTILLSGSLVWAAMPKTSVDGAIAEPQALDNPTAPAFNMSTATETSQPSATQINKPCEQVNTNNGPTEVHDASVVATETQEAAVTESVEVENTVSVNPSDEKTSTVDQTQEVKDPATQTGSRSIKLKVVKDGKK